MKSIALSFLLLFISTTLLTQEGPNTIDRQIMVQLKDRDNINLLIKNHNLSVVDIISERFNIYLLKNNDQSRSNSDILRELSSESYIHNIQNNHIVSLRGNNELLPNDSLFEDQWALLNTGQTSGYEGADIDATLAWDVTTGGLTAHGDTIVVAVIDGGCDIDHEDLNLWKNFAEIPDNGIDDDENGYVDDFDGWNAYNNSGVIPDNNHGIHVSGIIGAIGNNDIGVTGVNWNVKVLPIAGESSNEATVVKALSYVYVIRETYNLSNGSEGAFIVAQNNSFGVDKAQPEDYPIWEAMYDSLGTLGILSMGATANRAWDIDTVGDVPTAFETPYMISVTNTTNKDRLNTSAGFGATTIDLGAPGSMILSLGINNNYRVSSGTSMATPHVSATAALLMAAADSLFIAEYKSNPAQGALKIKDYIINGVDHLETLEGKTVSGGRLNVLNSINLLLLGSPLKLSIQEISEELPLDYTLEKELIITNNSQDTVDYTITPVYRQDWVQLSYDQSAIPPNHNDTLIITISTFDIDTGNYFCNLDIVIDESQAIEFPVSIKVYDDTGLDEQTKETISVYPLPATNQLSIDFKIPEGGTYDLVIYNSDGKIIHVFNRFLEPGRFVYNWDIGYLKSGLYYYSLIANDKSFTGKFIKL